MRIRTFRDDGAVYNPNVCLYAPALTRDILWALDKFKPEYSHAGDVVLLGMDRDRQHLGIPSIFD